MKIRVGGLESKQTLTIEIADYSSFQHLKHCIAQAIQFPSPSSLRLFLNGTDEISPPSPDDTILSLGIASGDLIFYSVLADEQAVEIEDEPEKFDWCFPESCFVRRLSRVLRDNFGETNLEYKLMISAVHSVLFESGFVLALDEKLRFPSSMAFTTFHYTLPQLMPPSKEGSGEMESVVLKFEAIKNFLHVYGHVTKSSSGSIFRIDLDLLRFAPVISSLRSSTTAGTGEDLQGELFELWKTVTDGLALPLKVDLCAQAGLAGPACFAQLPAELLLSILELLPGEDVARAGCASRDLAYLARDDGLWRRKFEEEFAEAVPAAERPKNAYAKRWWWGRRDWLASYLMWEPVPGFPIYMGPAPAFLLNFEPVPLPQFLREVIGSIFGDSAAFKDYDLFGGMVVGDLPDYGW